MTRERKWLPALVTGVLAAVLLASQGLVTPAAAQGECAAGGVRVMSKDWIKVAPPRFELDPQSVLDMAVDPANPDHFFVTNGTELMETKDAGCTWDSLYSDPATIGNRGTGMAIQIPASGPPGRMVLVTEHPQGTSVSLTDDWGQTWRTSTDAEADFSGLWTCPGRYRGVRGALQISPSDPQVMYICMSLPGQSVNDLYFSTYVSRDGGVTWAPTADAVGNGVGFAARYNGPLSTATIQVYIDPTDPKKLWALGGLQPFMQARDVWHGFVLRSDNGGASWSGIRRSNGWPEYNDLTVVGRTGGGKSLFVTSQAQPECASEDAGCVLASDDDGSSWRVIPPDFGMTPTVIEPGKADRHFVVARGEQGTYVYRLDTRRGTWANISSADPEQHPLGIDVSRHGPRTGYFVFSSFGIDRFTGKV